MKRGAYFSLRFSSFFLPSNEYKKDPIFIYFSWAAEFISSNIVSVRFEKTPFPAAPTRPDWGYWVEWVLERRINRSKQTGRNWRFLCSNVCIQNFSLLFHRWRFFFVPRSSRPTLPGWWNGMVSILALLNMQYLLKYELQNFLLTPHNCIIVRLRQR